MEVRRAVREDAPLVAAIAKQEDIAEMEAMNTTVLDALYEGFDLSDVSLTAVHDGKPVCMAGVYSYGIVGGGCAWLLGSDFSGMRKTFLKQSKVLCDKLMRRYSYLDCLVDARHVRAIRWLNWLGFSTENEEVHNGFLFYKMRRDAC